MGDINMGDTKVQVTPAIVHKGMRVCRGDGWKWGSQDVIDGKLDGPFQNELRILQKIAKKMENSYCVRNYSVSFNIWIHLICRSMLNLSTFLTFSILIPDIFIE